MKIEKLYEVTFDTEESIITATISKPNEIVMLMSSGKVIRFDLDKKEGKYLFSVNSNISYSDGGFDIAAKTSIYTLDEIVVVANDFKRHAFVHHSDEYHAINLWRKEYHADISCYPIALFKNEANIPHIIYGIDWNHIQIMNLDTRQVLTASKSLIEENAEEKHIELNKKYNQAANLPWPSPYEYFFGKLKIAPDNNYFLSAGWNWGSCDSYRIYNLASFIDNPRITDIPIDSWEHENRAVCWINEQTIAVAYNPFTEGDDDADANSPCEIHFYDFINEQAVLNKKIKVEELDIVSAEIEFSNELNSILAFSDKFGIAVISLEGIIKYQNKDLKVNNCFANTNQFITANDKTVVINKIIQ